MFDEKTKKYLAGLLIGMTAVASTACTQKNASTGTASEVKLSGEEIYPIECADELTVWGELNTNLSTLVTNLGETHFAKELQEKTGVKIKFVHPAQGQQTEQFNLMIASNDLPDIVRYNWQAFGAQNAIDSGYILDLNEAIDKWAPNFKKLLSERPDYDKMIKTDEGRYYAFPGLAGDSVNCIYSGPMVRKDWLDKLGMEVPETIDEFETMLKRFKNELNVDIPLSMVYGLLPQTFGPAYGVSHAYYIDDNGKVKFGPAEDAYKEYLTKMHSWYEQGLIDSNIANVDLKTLETNLLNDRVGVTSFTAAGGLGKWMNAKQGSGSSFELVGIPLPVRNKGEHQARYTRDWEYAPSCAYAISTSCKNPELAVRFLDYGYGEEGSMLYNFGTEGVSYNMVDGEPKLTDMILNSEKGTSQALMEYCMGSYSGPFVTDGRLTEQMQSKPIQAREAVITWATDADITTHALPLLSFTKAEQQELAKLGSEFGTYAGEMGLKFIVGTESLDKFDEYQKRIEKFNVARALEIYEQALARYNKR